MTLALDHTPAAALTLRATRLVRAWFTRFHQYWFVEYVEPSDPFASLSSRERADLPTWHPVDPEA